MGSSSSRVPRLELWRGRRPADKEGLCAASGKKEEPFGVERRRHIPGSGSPSGDLLRESHLGYVLMTMGWNGKFGHVGISFFALLGALSVAACGGDSDDADGGGGSVSSGISSEKKVDELDAGEREQLCEAGQAALDEAIVDLQGLTCRSVGLGAYVVALTASEDGVAACEEAVSGCESGEGEPAFEVEETDCSSEEDQIPAGCTASVGEMETCISDMVEETSARASEVELPTCGEIEQFLKDAAENPMEGEEEVDVDVDPQDVPSCAKLPEICFE